MTKHLISRSLGSTLYFENEAKVEGSSEGYSGTKHMGRLQEKDSFVGNYVFLDKVTQNCVIGHLLGANA